MGDGTGSGRRSGGGWVCGCMVAALLVGACVLTLLLPPASVVHAAPVSVTNCTDSGSGSLRDAIGSAAAGDTITFATDCPTTGPITLTNGTLTLSRDVTIDGTGHTVVIDGGCSTDANSDCTGGGNTVFLISGGNVTTLRALTIQHGNTSNNGSLAGGIYLNAGTLTLTNSTLAHNSTGFYGGGIFNAGTLTVTGSTFANNVAAQGGGGIFNGIGTLTVTNSTFANNSATNGGGIENRNFGTVTVTNTILAGNPGGDVHNNTSGTITDGGHNLVGTSSGYTFTAPGDTTGPALLAPLGNYGGTTQTFALLPGSAALGGGDATTCASTTTPAAAPVRGVDQRGSTRPDPGTTACDIGAFESQGFTLAKTGGDAQSIVFGSPTPFAPLAATVTSKDAGVTVNGSSLTFVIVPGTSSATFRAAGSTGCTVSLDKLTASGCPVNGSGVATSPPFMGTVPGGFTVTVSATPGDAPGATYTETVTKATPTVSVTSSANPSVVGTSVTFTATVSGIAGTIPTGTVQFASTSTGSTTSTPLGAPVALDGSGQATFATSTLSVGLHHLTATYTPASPGPYTTSQGAQDVTIIAAALVSIAVTPVNGTVKVGQVQQFTATGTYANNTTADLTSQVTWSSDAAAIAGVDASGKGTGQSPGSAHIRATQGTISGQASVTVSAPTPVGIAPAPAPSGR